MTCCRSSSDVFPSSLHCFIYLAYIPRAQFSIFSPTPVCVCVLSNNGYHTRALCSTTLAQHVCARVSLLAVGV
jgi:hypothetical protein